MTALTTLSSVRQQFSPDVLRVSDEAGVPGFTGNDLLHFTSGQGAVRVHGSRDLTYRHKSDGYTRNESTAA